MRMKIAIVALLAMFGAAEAFASYIVVLKDGTRYIARDKWTMVDGKAIIVLHNGGTTMQLDPTVIDLAETDRANKAGVGDARLLAVGGRPASEAKKQAPSLGSLTQLKQREKAASAVTGTGTSVRETPGSGMVGVDIISRFQAAYENMALYQNQVTATGPSTLKIEIIADNEDQVRKAISATSYILAKLPGATGKKVNSIDLVLSTVRGTAAGRFQMSFDDAVAIDSKQTTWSQYYVDKVIF